MNENILVAIAGFIVIMVIILNDTKFPFRNKERKRILDREYKKIMECDKIK